MNFSTLFRGARGSAAILFLSAGVGFPLDWPQWLGPNRDGVSLETGLLKQWPSNGPAMLWKATGLGGGYSTPSIVQGRIYGAGYRGGNEVVWCLDAKDGKEIWSVRTGPANKNFDYSEGPRATPTIDGERLYMLGGAGNLICLQSANGAEVWRKDFKSDFGGRLMSDWGFSESPLVDGDKLVCTPGSLKGTLVALDKKTGTLRWQSKDFTDKAAYASLVPASIGGVAQYVQLTEASVAGVAAEDGRLLWQAARRGRVAVIPTPLVYKNEIFVTSAYNVGCNLFRVTPAGKEFKAEQVYANKELVNHHGGVVRVGEHVYGHSDTRGWVCLEWKTGNVVWNKRGVDKGSIVCADGHLYCRSEGRKGTVALVEATPKGYEEKGRFDQPNRSGRESWPHPVIAEGKLYLRDQDLLLCYDIKEK